MTPAGRVTVEKVNGKSSVTACFSKYPLKFIIPTKVGNSKPDVVWIYTLTYGGGIVSGDSITCNFTITSSCTVVLTTQASTKVYKSLASKCSYQFLEASVGSDGLFVVIPDPVTCFSTAKYSQKQVFRMENDSSLVLVDWVTSGRHESGERWDFDLYKSVNQIYLEGDVPLLLDSVLLEKTDIFSVAERMQGYQVIAMVVFWGPKTNHLQKKVQEDVKRMMNEQLQFLPHTSAQGVNTSSDNRLNKPDFVASSSIFGPEGKGIIVRVVATTTESVYRFLRNQLSSLEPLLGVSPYS